MEKSPIDPRENPAFAPFSALMSATHNDEKIVEAAVNEIWLTLQEAASSAGLIAEFDQEKKGLNFRLTQNGNTARVSFTPEEKVFRAFLFQRHHKLAEGEIFVAYDPSKGAFSGCGSASHLHPATIIANKVSDLLRQ